MAKALLWLLALALVLASIGLVVSLSRERGAQVRAESVVDSSGCLVCHGDPRYQPKTSSRPWQELYVETVVLASSTHSSIECTSCHLTFDTSQPLQEAAIQELCGRCHAQERALQEASVHADPKVATCLDCHSPGGSGHDIPALLTAASPAFPKNVPQTCGGCHADEDLMAQYNLNADVYATYTDSPHGKVMQLTGSDLDGLNPATCVTCHGSHDVKKADSPSSPVSSTASLARLCATCHRGANENFARSLAGHKEFTAQESPAPFYGERFFFVLTASVVGLGILMVGLEGFGWLSRGNGNEKGSGGGPSPAGRGPTPKGEAQGNPHNPGSSGHGASFAVTSPPQAKTLPSARPQGSAIQVQDLALPQEILRFDIHQRLQHFVMMASFLVLAFTGLPQKFPDWGVSQWLIGMWGGLDTARIIHRSAGLIMIVDCLYHLGYISYSTLILKRPFPVWMIPTPKDVADFFQDLQYWFGRSCERPRFGRFSYREKFDYWAIFWGMPVMALSGLILMFPVLATKVLPGEAVSAALIAHSDEAVLAVLWIFIVHLFFVHLNPRFFPLNRAIFTGKMPSHLYAEEHPLELSALSGDRRHAETGKMSDGGRA